jgi:hypothetical protein
MTVTLQSAPVTPTLKSVCLESLLSYRHPHVLQRFQKEYNYTPEAADLIFEDLMRFFYLGHRNQQLILAGECQNHCVAIYTPMSAIDDLWHTFLLFTRDYAEFSQEYLGYFLHHAPNVDEMPITDDPVRLQQFLELVYDELGEDTFVRWFSDCLE